MSTPFYVGIPYRALVTTIPGSVQLGGHEAHDKKHSTYDLLYKGQEEPPCKAKQYLIAVVAPRNRLYLVLGVTI
jgi:hypothetical protein